MPNKTRSIDEKSQQSIQDTASVTGQSILIIDDSRVTQRLLQEVLKPQGFILYSATSGEEGLRCFFETRPDLVLLDIVLPGLDGFETCRRLLTLADVPIIFLSTMADEDAIVRGLEAGAVDYVEKPFSPKVLLARVRGALRWYAFPRAIPDPVEAAPSTAYDDGYLTINIAHRRVTVGGKIARLTATEFNLLTHIFENAGQVCTFVQILEHVWGWDEGDKANVYTYIRRLRSKLETAPNSPRYITVAHGVGYSFEKQ